ncbi:MAG: hypothetical protein KKE44_07235 [Proteobacteria bacterium]|nr:hypothetical protein [Pseudomonadota bacterium]MBU1582523.1 hypothetical protein [Pseudomonadota bacterium]MBU2452630.1 hypothetical protein [Pseudomonadota bacterium]MBU2630285.1 hypothetical protein [Pseudomonadota bacterium]
MVIHIKIMNYKGRILAVPANAACPLLGGQDGSGISDQDADIQIADIDPQLQSAGEYHSQKFSCGKLRFNGSSFLWQKACPVNADLI